MDKETLTQQLLGAFNKEAKRTGIVTYMNDDTKLLIKFMAQLKHETSSTYQRKVLLKQLENDIKALSEDELKKFDNILNSKGAL